jgi:hypothetical protein
MKRLMLITTLAAATLAPAVASAWPGRPSDPPTAGDPVHEPNWLPDRGAYYGGDTYDTRSSERFRDRWITLSSFTPGRQGRETVQLTGRERRIDRIKIRAVRGAPVVKQVILQYGNGTYERRPVNLQLRPGQESTISLAPDRRVERIMVLTDPKAGGAYSLLGAG